MSWPGIEHATLLLRDTGTNDGITASARNASKHFLAELTDAASIFDESGARVAGAPALCSTVADAGGRAEALAPVVWLMVAVDGIALFSLILANPGNLSGSAPVPAPWKRRRFLR